MIIQSVGVIGSGVMGGGLAQSLAQTGHDVVLMDSKNSALERVKENFVKNIRLQRMFVKYQSNESPEDILERITFTTQSDDLAAVDYLIENVTEKWNIKKDVFQHIDKICKDTCVFASNTSAIPIARLATATNRPDKVIGLHFMNPVPLKPTVEMITSQYASKQTIEASQQLLHQMKKDWIMVNDSPGFVSNRVLMLTINEAIYLVQEKVAPPQEIDKVFKSCFGNKMGPLETADLIGLDTILLSLDVLLEALKNDKFTPCTLLKEMVDKGKLGRKSGQGFFKYPVV